jgi:hypothetical protein
MVIEIGKFKLVSNDDRFNLVETKVIENKDFQTKLKTGEISEKDVEIGFDMQLETAIKYIINRNLNDQAIIVDLPTYIKMYQKEREKVTNLLK